MEKQSKKNTEKDIIRFQEEEKSLLFSMIKSYRSIIKDNYFNHQLNEKEKILTEKNIFQALIRDLRNELNFYQSKIQKLDDKTHHLYNSAEGLKNLLTTYVDKALADDNIDPQVFLNQLEVSVERFPYAYDMSHVDFSKQTNFDQNYDYRLGNENQDGDNQGNENQGSDGQGSDGPESQGDTSQVGTGQRNDRSDKKNKVYKGDLPNRITQMTNELITQRRKTSRYKIYKDLIQYIRHFMPQEVPAKILFKSINKARINSPKVSDQANALIDETTARRYAERHNYPW